MKHWLAPLLEGKEMSKSEHDWMEQRLESMTVKEELLFRGAMQIELPRDIQTTVQILQGLDHYQLLYGAEDDVLMGRFVMEHIHTPTHAARATLPPKLSGQPTGRTVQAVLWRGTMWSGGTRSVPCRKWIPVCRCLPPGKMPFASNWSAKTIWRESRSDFPTQANTWITPTRMNCFWG